MTGAAVTAVLVTYDPVTEILIERYNADVSQRVIDDLVRNERDGLESALAPLRASMTKLDVEVVFARQTASAFCAAARDHDASLIVKPLAASAHRADFLHAPVDWQLMREAPCPVLFTRAAAVADAGARTRDGRRQRRCPRPVERRHPAARRGGRSDRRRGIPRCNRGAGACAVRQDLRGGAGLRVDAGAVARDATGSTRPRCCSRSAWRRRRSTWWKAAPRMSSVHSPPSCRPG